MIIRPFGAQKHSFHSKILTNDVLINDYTSQTLTKLIYIHFPTVLDILVDNPLLNPKIYKLLQRILKFSQVDNL